MQRREFLAASAVATSAVAAAPLAAGAQAAAGDRQFYEWRTYRVANDAKHTIVSKYLETAALPAWGRLGLGPVGAFREVGPDATLALHVLVTYPSLAALGTAREALEADGDYQKHAVDYLAATKEDPAFERIESWLLIAFAGAPQLTPPTKKPGLYELRTYANHGEDRARAKIEMFNDGEIDIFPKCGFENVFFGETLIGSGIPSLKYMLASPDMAANETGWKTFIAHPDFIRMRDDPKYARTEPNITKLYLEPLAFSQV